MQDGLEQLTTSFYTYVTDVFALAVQLHVLNLTLTLLLCILYYLFILRPFVQRVRHATDCSDHGLSRLQEASLEFTMRLP